MHAAPFCQVVPQAGHQVSFQVGDREVLRWHQGRDYPRPYFFPLIGPSGKPLTRMGHPGAPNHDHHQSIWFAHNKVLGIDFWGNNSSAAIRQLQWLAYEDGNNHCRMAVELGWFDGHDPMPLLKQQLICEVRPLERANEVCLEIQTRFDPISESLEFQQTNFGFFAVRVARDISGHFGGGLLTNSEGAEKEKAIFGKPAVWVDYSGQTGSEPTSWEGLTYLDHPQNPGQPTGWHVREDGWMCASPTMNAPLVTSARSPLILRYQLLTHVGKVDPDRCDQQYRDFAASPGLQVRKSTRPHETWEIFRE